MPHQPPDGPPITSSSVHTELAAMRKLAATLDALDAATRWRVARWIVERYLPDTPRGEEQP